MTFPEECFARRKPSLLHTSTSLRCTVAVLTGSSAEATALGGVAKMLAETAESVARTARELKGISPDE